MKFVIKHEIKGRIRIHILQSRMTFEQADTLEYYLSNNKLVTSVKVRERLQDATISYIGSREDIIKLPKVELHCHLDGSLSREFVEKRLGRQVGKEELSVSNDCTSLAEYLEKFDLPGQCLQDEEGLEEAGYDVLRSMKQENVIYSEIRFAPLLSETDDMNCNKVIEAVLRGLERGKKEFGIDFGLIVCAMRHHSEEMNWRMIRTAREYLGSGVCAADLAGAEALYPMSEFMDIFTETKKMGMPFTLHAGECGNPQNVIDSINVGAGRIGHGIAMRGNQEIRKKIGRAHV